MPGGAFALRLLQPPWLPPLSTEGTTIFVVPPTDATVTADLSVVLAEALYSLDIGPASSTPLALARALEASLPPVALADEAPAGTASGATGLQVSWQQRKQEVGDAIPPRRLSRWPCNPDLSAEPSSPKRAIADDAMVDQMITSFVPYL